MEWRTHKLGWLGQILRLFQMVGATACIVYYGRDITAAHREDKYNDSKWMYALVVACMALITSFIYFVCGFFFEFRAFSILAVWDFVLTILWAAVAGIFGMLYWNENPEMDEKIKQMKVAAGFDVANVILWVLTAAIGFWRFFIGSGDLMHKGRVHRQKTTQ